MNEQLPFIASLDITNRDGKDIIYKYFTQEAIDWFYPLKPYTKLEYEWVINNINMKDRLVIDIGCHQGNYSVVFTSCGATVLAIDCNKIALTYTSDNLRRYGRPYFMQECFIEGEKQHLSRLQGCGEQPGRFRTMSWLKSISWAAEKPIYVIKIDIEGTEFELFPEALNSMCEVRYWIVEIHPSAGNPDDIIRHFLQRDFEVLLVNRENLTVEPYDSYDWTSHATIIASGKYWGDTL